MRRIVILSVVFYCFLICGCASSERMARLSGGVFQEYSVPRDHRMRSVKYQQKTKVYAKTEQRFSEESLVNIWPFFYRSDNYFSILWPFIDFDPYGMAIRPFYNHEGDDYSILFPLSNWNTADRDGWAAFVYWGPEKAGFFPLAHHSFNKKDGSFWYTPLLIHSWKYRNVRWNDWNYTREQTFTEFMLGWKKRTVEVDVTGKEYLFHEQEAELKKRFAFEGKKFPADLKKFRQEEFEKLPLQSRSSFGFFPLFSYSGVDGKKDDWSCNIGGLLADMEVTPNKKHISFLAGFGFNHDEKQYRIFERKQFEKNTFCLPLLSGMTNRDYYKNTPEWISVKKMYDLSFRTPFSQYRTEISAEYAKLTGGTMPQTICDGNILRLWLANYLQQKNLPTYRESEGGCLPLYMMKSKPGYFRWFSLPLLSGMEKDEQSTVWVSLPLLTYRKRTADESITTIGGSLIYGEKKSKSSRIDKPIFSRDTYWVKTEDQSEFEDEFAACGLYYHGRDGFAVAKTGVDAELLESIRKDAYSLRRRYHWMLSEDKRIKTLEDRNLNWKTASRLEELKKAVAVEEVRLQREKAQKDEAAFMKDVKKWEENARRLGLAFSLKTLEDGFEKSLETLFDRFTEMRYCEDFGSGLFFRKELAANGDHRWHTFLYMASGKKDGAEEYSQVLQFLYRYKRSGEREETLIFPFIAIQKDKDRQKFSFLWRVFETHSQNGKVGGYIFFIPYGERLP